MKFTKNSSSKGWNHWAKFSLAMWEFVSSTSRSSESLREVLTSWPVPVDWQAFSVFCSGRSSEQNWSRMCLSVSMHAHVLLRDEGAEFCVRKALALTAKLWGIVGLKKIGCTWLPRGLWVLCECDRLPHLGETLHFSLSLSLSSASSCLRAPCHQQSWGTKSWGSP